MGRASSKIFENVETFDDFKNEIFQNVINYSQTDYFNQETLQYVFLGLSDMNEKQQKQVLRFVRHVDRKLSMSGSTSGNRFHKVPTILAGCIYLRYFSDQVKDLSLDELIVLSRYSIVKPFELYSQSLEYLGKDLITAVTNKHYDFMFQGSFLDYAESKIRKGQGKSEVAEYIKDVPLDILKKETFEYERELSQEVGKYL